MEIMVNGQKENTPSRTLAELVTSKGLAPGALVVELNQTIIQQQQWQSTPLKAGDRLELLSFVGGG